MQENLKRIIVTGCNQGIGYGIVENLVNKSYHIIMACRSLEKANSARLQIANNDQTKLNKLEVMELDISKTQSIDDFVNKFQNQEKIDILLNNAGWAATSDAFDEQVARETLGINTFGTIDFTEKMLPFVKDHGKIIFVGSSAGKYKYYKSEYILNILRSDQTTTQQLIDLGNKFINDVKNNVYAQEGFPKSTYCVSKALINTYARVLGNQTNIRQRDIQTYTCCPGYVNTQMSKGNGKLTIQQGALTPVYLVELPQQINNDLQGKFFYLEQVASLEQ